MCPAKGRATTRMARLWERSRPTRQSARRSSKQRQARFARSSRPCDLSDPCVENPAPSAFSASDITRQIAYAIQLFLSNKLLQERALAPVPVAIPRGRVGIREIREPPRRLFEPL